MAHMVPLATEDNPLSPTSGHEWDGVQGGFGRLACRLGDLDFVHCIGYPMRLGHSMNVLVNGRGWSRQADFNTPHLLPCYCPVCCCIHAAPIAVGSFTVKVNGRGAGRIFDRIASCTAVMTGSSNVHAGG
tara:strand:+ start:1005 stop:1394 length:390 start_codon:yes stop_codon:yes gene_type:complete